MRIMKFVSVVPTAGNRFLTEGVEKMEPSSQVCTAEGEEAIGTG